MNAHTSRRSFLQSAGALTLFFALDGLPALAQEAGKLPNDLARNPKLDSWIKITAGGKVILQTGKVEIGQGVLTALAQICADELDVDIKRLTVVSGDTAICPNEGATAGSQSMPEGGTAVRYAAAEVRGLLVDMAAKRLKTDASGLSIKDGTIIHLATGKRVAFWTLIGGKSFARDAKGGFSPKTPSEHIYVGHDEPRLDLPAKIKGETIFVHDLRPANLVHGRVVRQPSYGATLISADIAAAEKMPGVLKVVRDGDFLGVIADKEWRAIKAANALRASAKWQETAALPADPHEWLTKQRANDLPIKRQARDGAAPAKTIAATYKRWFQMHGSIGPSTGLAEYANGTMTVYTHSQSVFDTGPAIAKMLKLAPEKVHLKHMNGSGCYGHNAADDAAADAAVLAYALPGKSVRVQWSRNDEHTSEPFGPAMLTKFAAGVDANGDVLDWNYELWSTPHGTRPGGDPGNLLAGRSVAAHYPMPVPQNGGPPNYAADRNAIPAYAFPGQSVTTHFVTDMPVHVSALRSLGAYANVFSIESFVDELAHAANADPVAYRLRQLKDPRAIAVVEAAAKSFGWADYKRAPNRGRGFAFARYKNIATYCAIALEIAFDPANQQIKVLRAAMAADAGEIVNPDGLKNQLEGGLLQSLSWTLKERIRYDAQHILSRDWNSYPILKMSEAPPIEIVLIDRPGEPFLGAGEASQGPASAALANALFDATGARVRETPLLPDAIRVATA